MTINWIKGKVLINHLLFPLTYTPIHLYLFNRRERCRNRSSLAAQNTLCINFMLFWTEGSSFFFTFLYLPHSLPIFNYSISPIFTLQRYKLSISSFSQSPFASLYYGQTYFSFHIFNFYWICLNMSSITKAIKLSVHWTVSPFYGTPIALFLNTESVL